MRLAALANANIMCVCVGVVGVVELSDVIIELTRLCYRIHLFIASVLTCDSLLASAPFR